MESEFTFIDLFAGIGGLRLPFREIDGLKGKCVLSSEKDAKARLTYESNFPDASFPDHVFDTDVTQLAVESVPVHDLLLAGFPCQPFSDAGKKLGFEDMRGTLFFDIMRIIDGLSRHGQDLERAPRVVLLENVKGLKSHDKGRTLSRILEELGNFYEVTNMVLDARDFGLPQSRQRIFIIGIRKDLPGASLFEATFRHSAAAQRDNRPALRVGQILEEHVDSKYTISDRLWASHQERKARHLARGNGWGYRLVTPDSAYTATLSARYYKDGAEILVQDSPNGNPRKLTPREAANLQGFPSGFKIPVSDVQAYKQFGNAVPVNVIRFIAHQIRPFLR